MKQLCNFVSDSINDIRMKICKSAILTGMLNLFYQ
jgi:hypothetical protein